MKKIFIILSSFLLCTGLASAQNKGFTAKALLKTFLSDNADKEVIIATAELEPKASTGLHSHPGDEYATVIQGTLELNRKGEIAKQVTAGQSYHNPKGLIHETKNIGTETAKIVSTFVIEKGKGLVEPVLNNN